MHKFARPVLHTFACFLAFLLVAVSVIAEPLFDKTQQTALRKAQAEMEEVFILVDTLHYSLGFHALPDRTRDQALDVALKLISVGASNAEKTRLLIGLMNSTRIKFPKNMEGDKLFQAFWRGFAEQLDLRLKVEAPFVK